MTDPELNKQLLTLGYSSLWLDFGLLTEALLQAQLNLFDKKDDKNTEHYRYAAFRHYLAGKEALTDTEFANYSELALSDSHRVMAGAAFIDLFTKVHLSDKQFDELIARLKELGDWTQHTIMRQTLLRKLQQKQLTDELFAECLDHGDTVVLEYVIGFADPEQLTILASKGKTKKIRNMSLQTLNRKYGST